MIIVSEGKDSGKFSIYLEYGKLLDFFKIAKSVSYDGRLQFEDSKMSVIEINLQNAVGLKLVMDIPKNHENVVSLDNLLSGTKKKYLVEFKNVLNILSAFNFKSDLIKCTIDETNNIILFEPKTSVEGLNRRGFVPILTNKFSRRKSLESLDDFVMKYGDDYTFMQIKVKCDDLYSAIRCISKMEHNSWVDGIILLGSNQGLTVSSSIPEICLTGKNQSVLNVPYFSITIPFSEELGCPDNIFVGAKSEKEWVASAFDSGYLLDFLNVLPKNCILTVSVSTNCVGMIETNLRGISLRYGIAPRTSDEKTRIIEDAYAKLIMLRD